MNKTKTNKGITLVALVITIIVLIILAGVSINAVMNGGLINNAKNAKNEFEIGKQNEVEQLVVLESYITEVKDEEVIADFAKAEIEEYTFKNSYLTGIALGTTKEDLELPANYKLYSVDGTTELADADTVATGMMLKKNDKEVGRIVIYGDVDCDGAMDLSDFSKIPTIAKNSKATEDYQKIAADLNHDNIVDLDDSEIIGMHLALMSVVVNQNVAAPNVASLKFENTSTRDRIINNFKSDKYRIEFIEEYDDYFITGVTQETLVSDIIAELKKYFDEDFIISSDGSTPLTGAIGTSGGELIIQGFYDAVSYNKVYSICYVMAL